MITAETIGAAAAAAPDMRAPETRARVAACGNEIARVSHGLSARAGWYHDPTTGALRHRNVGEMLMLIVSEVAEAMEGHRKGLADDKLPHRPMIEVELADAVIRIGDLAGYLGLDLGGAIAEKLAYNATRADHRPEARAAAGGKRY